MFETLIAKVRRQMAETDWKLSQCTDIYRLAQVLKDHADTMVNLHDDAVKICVLNDGES